MSVHVIFVNTYLIIFNIKVAYNDDQGTANSRRYKRTSLHKTIFFFSEKAKYKYTSYYKKYTLRRKINA
jgi:hypothetical protein